jgi:hypothetical protein
MTSQWQPILYGSPPNFPGYGWMTPHPVNSLLLPILDPYCRNDYLQNRSEWIIGEKGGRVFFGRYAWVGELLKPEHPAARDEVQRKLNFFLGYSAPAGTPLPRVKDFGRIEETIKTDLEKFYRELSRTLGGITPAPTPFNFSGAQGEAASDHAWDKAAAVIGKEKKSILLIMDQQGNIQTKDLQPEPPPRSDAQPPHSGYDPEAKKKRRTVRPRPIEAACGWVCRHLPF